MLSFVGRRAAAAVAALVGAALLSPAHVATAAPTSSGVALGAATLLDTPPVAGMVKDSSGIPIPNVQVIVTALNRVTTTNAAGAFMLRGLPAGSYHLSAILIGYAPGHADVVIPTTGDSVRVAIVMHQSALQLTGIQVTATPVGTDPRNVIQAATELSGQALARNLAPTVAQSLENEPGVSVRYNGPAATAPVIRGLQGERILVLQDGDRAGDLSSAAPDHGVSIDPLTAQRIEVVRGPASLLYGNSALGGVVNVISNDIPSAIPSHVEGFMAGQAESATPGGGLAGGVTVPIGSSFAVVARGGGRHATTCAKVAAIDSITPTSGTITASVASGSAPRRRPGASSTAAITSTTAFRRPTEKVRTSKGRATRSWGARTSTLECRQSDPCGSLAPVNGTAMTRSRARERSTPASISKRKPSMHSRARSSVLSPAHSAHRACSSSMDRRARKH